MKPIRALNSPVEFVYLVPWQEIGKNLLEEVLQSYFISSSDHFLLVLECDLRNFNFSFVYAALVFIKLTEAWALLVQGNADKETSIDQELLKNSSYSRLGAARTNQK